MLASDLKDLNRKEAYRAVVKFGETSQAQLSRTIGVSAPTAMKIVDFLLRKDILREAGDGLSAVGRKPRLLKFNPQCAVTVGIEIEGDTHKVAVVDASGKIRAMRRVAAERDFKELVRNTLINEVTGVLNEEPDLARRLIAIGFGVPGVVDPVRRVVEFAPLVGVKEPMNVGPYLDELQSTFGVPVVIENDVNAAALGEWDARQSDPPRDLIYVSLGTGIGAGIILDGRLRRGIHHSAGELGYVVRDAGFRTNRGSPGWLEEQLGASFVATRYSLPTDQLLNGGAPLDEDTRRAMIREMTEPLASAIANLDTILDIDLFVIGGLFGRALGPKFVEQIGHRVLAMTVSPVACEEPQSAEPGIIGAASLAREAELDRFLQEA